MDSHDAQSLVSRYLHGAGQGAGHGADKGYQLTIDELSWMVDHSTRLGRLRLELLRALQSALHSSSTPGVVADLKELLTDLIIMQSRLAGREEQLQDLLHQLTEARLLERVSVDEAAMKSAIQDIIEAFAHVREMAGDEG